MVDFQSWPKIPRLYRDMTITEKMDGTNAAVIIEEITDDKPVNEEFLLGRGVWHEIVGDISEPTYVAVYAQSRNRLINREADNAGFARWVSENVETLIRDLGPGRHFGEWWGSGIQRKYDQTGKFFSLFNTHRWLQDQAFETVNLLVVPVLYEGVFSQGAIQTTLEILRDEGSPATACEFGRPEGIVVYHHSARQYFKVLLENDDQPKGNPVRRG